MSHLYSIFPHSYLVLDLAHPGLDPFSPHWWIFDASTVVYEYMLFNGRYTVETELQYVHL